MANAKTRADIDALPVLPYATVRADIQSGDLLFASGDYTVSRMIRNLTDSAWSHVGILLKFPEIDRVLLLESVEDMGVRLAPLSKYTKDYEGGKPYKGRLVVARQNRVGPDAIGLVTQFGIDELTQPYDKEEVARIIARIALGKGKPKRNRAYICSELVHECFARAGHPFDFHRSGFISPGDIWRHPSVTEWWRIA